MSSFYRVRTDTDYKTSDHLRHGYEEECDYQRSLRLLQKRFAGRVGEAIDSRHDFLLLRFSDTPDRSDTTIWLPRLLLQETPPPRREAETDPVEAMLDEVFGFD